MSDLAKALLEMKKGNLKESRLRLERLATSHPKDPAVLYNLGVCYTRLGLMDSAVKALENASKLDPRNVNIWTVLAFAYAHIEKFDKARALLEKAIGLDQNNFYALKNLGAITAQCGDNEAAIEYFERAAQLEPGNAEVNYGLALALEERGDQERALSLYRSIVQQKDGAEVREWAEEAIGRITTGSKASDGPRMEHIIYCLHALRLFSTMEKKELKLVLQEIAGMVENDIDQGDPNQRYALNTLEGSFTALQLICYLYVGLIKIGEDVDIGADLSEEYETALALFEKERTGA